VEKKHEKAYKSVKKGLLGVEKKSGLDPYQRERKEEKR